MLLTTSGKDLKVDRIQQAQKLFDKMKEDKRIRKIRTTFRKEMVEFSTIVGSDRYYEGFSFIPKVTSIC